MASDGVSTFRPQCAGQALADAGPELSMWNLRTHPPGMPRLAHAQQSICGAVPKRPSQALLVDTGLAIRRRVLGRHCPPEALLAWAGANGQ
jgi:hypothetical protein